MVILAQFSWYNRVKTHEQMILLVYLGLIFFLFYTLYTISNPKRVVLISTRTKLVLPILLEILETFDNDVNQMDFLDIGAGYGKVSKHMVKLKKFKNVIAVEINFLVVVLARILFFLRRLPIKYIRTNILNYKISKQTFIYCYMSVYIVSTLYKNKQLDDCIFVSLSFPIKDVVPTKTYDIKGFQKKLYVYDFRKS